MLGLVLGVMACGDSSSSTGDLPDGSPDATMDTDGGSTEPDAGLDAGRPMDGGDGPEDSGTPDDGGDPPEPLPDNGAIVFVTERFADGQREIVRIDGPGASETRLTMNDARDDLPRWSPDGTEIAFESDQSNGTLNIHVMQADGTNVRALTDSALDRRSPRWSPDGTRIAYIARFEIEGGGGTTGSDLMVRPADGSGTATSLTDGEAEEDQPRWSPDGNKIAFQRTSAEGSALFVVNADGSGEVQIGPDLDGDLGRPSWSPDSSRLVFQQRHEVSDDAGVRSTVDLLVALADASEPPVPLAADSMRDETRPAWSPDGRWIAFTVGSPPTGTEIYRIHPDGSGEERIIEAGANVGVLAPRWSPDASRLVYLRNEDEGSFNIEADIWVAGADGADPEELVGADGYDAFPHWGAAGS